MAIRFLRSALVVMVVASVFAVLAAETVEAGHPHRRGPVGYPTYQRDLFYNHYQGPSCYGGASAQMYISPYPTPARVGHTYTTYQPLMPHEFLYRHHRTYHTYHGEHGGYTRTSVLWY
jgi:hypothetical protein